jgi:hypothetical protein
MEGIPKTPKCLKVEINLLKIIHYFTEVFACIEVIWGGHDCAKELGPEVFGFSITFEIWDKESNQEE